MSRAGSACGRQLRGRWRSFSTTVSAANPLTEPRDPVGAVDAPGAGDRHAGGRAGPRPSPGLQRGQARVQPRAHDDAEDVGARHHRSGQEGGANRALMEVDADNPPVAREPVTGRHGARRGIPLRPHESAASSTASPEDAANAGSAVKPSDTSPPRDSSIRRAIFAKASARPSPWSRSSPSARPSRRPSARPALRLRSRKERNSGSSSGPVPSRAPREPSRPAPEPRRSTPKEPSRSAPRGSPRPADPQTPGSVRNPVGIAFELVARQPRQPPLPGWPSAYAARPPTLPESPRPRRSGACPGRRSCCGRPPAPRPGRRPRPTPSPWRPAAGRAPGADIRTRRPAGCATPRPERRAATDPSSRSP